MLFTTTAVARLSRSAPSIARGFTSTSVRNGAPKVHYDHFVSGWSDMDDEPHTEGKFHIETFNKISPQVRAFIWFHAVIHPRRSHTMSDLITWLSPFNFFHGRCLTNNIIFCVILFLPSVYLLWILITCAIIIMPHSALYWLDFDSYIIYVFN